MLPWNVTFVYFGSLAHTVADVIEGRAGPNMTVSVFFLVLSGCLLVVVVFYITFIAK